MIERSNRVTLSNKDQINSLINCTMCTLHNVHCKVVSMHGGNCVNGKKKFIKIAH